MTISSLLLFVPYALFLMMFFVIAGFGIYHSWKFGYRAAYAQSATIAFLAGVVVIMGLSLLAILTLDWNMTWEITVTS